MSLSLKEIRVMAKMGGLLTTKGAFGKCSAMWTYQGQEGEPHALLAKGGHSDGYFNVNVVTQFPSFCNDFAWRISKKLLEEGTIDAVVSSSYAAIPFGHAVAKELEAVFVFTEKQGKEQVWAGRFELPKGTRVLQVEELITTMGTTESVRQAVQKDNPNPVEFVEIDGKVAVATIVHRPAELPIEYSDYKVVALMEREVHNWLPEECPLCKDGSEALKPKPNWAEFARYI